MSNILTWCLPAVTPAVNQDSANMEKATETLHRMANTTFLNTEPWQHMRGNNLKSLSSLNQPFGVPCQTALLNALDTQWHGWLCFLSSAYSWHCQMISSKVDSCAFALLFPTVSRAMREQAHDAKMKCVQSLDWSGQAGLLGGFLEWVATTKKWSDSGSGESLRTVRGHCLGH
jgi:hypothetical protein